MPDAIIENPIINSPFREPSRHFKFEREGITNAIIEGRRESIYFVPIARSKSRHKNQLTFETEWTLDRIKENTFINKVRRRVKDWREGGYQGATRTTKRLLAYWTNPEREKKLFFCQQEALETAIYLNEIAERNQDHWILNQLREYNAEANPLLFRIAFKMATGSGKTVVMAMLVAYHTLNKVDNPRDARFSDAFLFITPGITIKDRLRVLLPSDSDNYYAQRDLVPTDCFDALSKARLEITNYHALKLRDIDIGGSGANRLSKRWIEEVARKESPAAMVNRVCKNLKGKKNIIVINDEAHHCYRRKVDAEEESLAGAEKDEAKQNNEEARVWISGIEAVKEKLGVKVVYDLSATPFFLRGSGYDEGTLFPWVVSDFSLIDAIESGIVKIPRVPVSDNRAAGDPDFRELWLSIKDDLPKKGRKTGSYDTNQLPPQLESAIRSLYADYEKSYRQWESNRIGSPPVMIVVCNNTNVSKFVYEFISGYEKEIGEGDEKQTVIVKGALDIFRNEDGQQWLHKPNTLLIDSQQLESGEEIDEQFKKTFAREISEFKADYLKRFPGRSADQISDAEILREVMNTVGKPGRLGESIKCVVSVSMLTEGWDANTVTHILGVRAFTTQLLCEQVVGRALRRMSYALNDAGFFEPEYAEVYGVPFSFIPTGKPSSMVQKPKAVTRIKALDHRAEFEITFPRLVGYRYDIRDEPLSATFSDDDALTLSSEEVATITDTEPILGKHNRHELFDNLKRYRSQEIAFIIAKEILHTHLVDVDGSPKPWHFPSLVGIVKQFIQTQVRCKDDAFPQLLALQFYRSRAAEKIYRAVVRCSQSRPQSKRLLPILRQYDFIGSTRYIDFDTSKNVIEAYKSHVGFVVADTESWEQKLAQAFEELPEVTAYIKNQGLEFVVPYTLDGKEHAYYPDFIAKMKTPSGACINVIVEVTGKKDVAKEAKVETMKTLWIPAVNNAEKFGHWAFLEIRDVYDAKNLIRTFLATL
jgi:type III restriction enzyme